MPKSIKSSSVLKLRVGSNSTSSIDFFSVMSSSESIASVLNANTSCGDVESEMDVSDATDSILLLERVKETSSGVCDGVLSKKFDVV